MQNQGKPVKWEKVYIFISSTFNDMHAERDYLIKRVFPKLSEWCEKRKLHMVDIDLRWGVTEADTQNKNVVKVCLDGIDKCRPFFVCFLGQRYGTIVGPERVSEEAMKNYPGLEDAINKGSSIIELEILHSVISPFHSKQTIEDKGYHRSEYAYFYFRDDSYLRNLPAEPWYLRKAYSDAAEADERERNKLQTKRDGLIQRIKHEKRPVHIYNATWSEDKTTPEIALPLQCPSALEEKQERWRGNWHKYAGVRVDRLDVEETSEAAKAREFNEKLTRGRLADFKCDGEGLGDVIWRDLIQAVERRFPDHKEVEILPELQKEIDQQEQFVFINSEGFIERAGDFDELDEYVDSDSNRLFVLTAEAGMGKSMLLANWVNNYLGRIQNEPDHSIHFRFVGASDGSNTVHSLLRLLLREIKEVAGKLDDDIPDDAQKLRNALPGLLGQIGERGKTVIVIDALNQLETGLSDLAWLPRQLPDNIKLIVSFKRGEEAAEKLYDSLTRDERVQLSEVKPFKGEADRRKLVAAYLNQYFKALDERHIATLIGSPSAHNPLYLKVVLSEMRVFGVFAKLEEKIRGDFGETPESAFEGMLQRLETDPAYSPIEPGEALPLIFGLLAHSRHGLAVEELTSILLEARGEEDSQKNRQNAKDTAYFFLRQVRPFLARRGGRYDFFYESFKNAAFNRYVTEEAALPKRTSEDWHRLLADYFCSLPLWDEKGEAAEELRPQRKLPNSRKVAEQPYHLTGAHDWERLEGTLTDLRFIEAKSAAGMTYDLVADYDAALDALPEAQEERQKELEHEARVKKYTEDLIAYAKGEIEHLDIIHSVEPWSDEKIRKDTERIIHNPTRLVRIGAFYQFVNSESHAFVKFASHPGFSMQQAYNSAGSGPVASAAEGIVNTGIDDVLLLHHPSQRLEYNLHPAVLRTLEGHTDWVNSVSVTPDGKMAVSGSSDGTLRVWELKTGQCLRTLEGHTGDVRSVSITPDGKRAVSGSHDQTLRVWDLETRECLRTLEGHTGFIPSVSITPDGKRAVSGSYDKTLRVWDLESGECLRTLEGHTDEVCSVSVTPGKRAVSGSCDNTLRVWDLESGECLKTLEGHTDYVLSVSVTPNGKRAVSGSRDGTLRVWDLESGECLKALEGHTGLVWSVSITPEGKRAVSGSDDNTLRVWDLESGECLKTLEGHRSSVYSVSITPDGKRAVSGSRDRSLRVWDMESEECLKTLVGHTDSVNSVSITPDGKMAVSGSYDNTLRVWDLESGECLKTLVGHTEKVWSVSVTPDGKRAVSVSGKHIGEGDSTPLHMQVSIDNTVRVWDLESGECLKTLVGHTDDVESVSITPDGRRAVSISGDNTLRVWDLESGRCLAVLQVNGEVLSLSEVTPVGRCALGTKGSEVFIITPLNFPAETPLVSPVRIWLPDKPKHGLFSKGRTGDWDDNVTTLCLWCGKHFPVAHEILDVIKSINRNAKLSPDQSPCLELPAEAWEEPRLLSECPYCRRPLKFNPFIVDNSGK